jgi:tetratricopeptide (TPR) repeat protein
MDSPGAGLAIRSFYEKSTAPDDREAARDLGIALTMMGVQGQARPEHAADRALPLLDAAVQADPEDFDAWEARAFALTAQHRNAAALAVLEAVLAKAPERETALAPAAALAQTLEQSDRALAYWRRAVALNPWLPEYRQNLALLLMAQGAWDEVRPQAEAWLRLEPASIPARRLWISCLIRSGNRDEARAEFAKIEALRPPDLDQLKAWFDRQIR